MKYPCSVAFLEPQIKTMTLHKWSFEVYGMKFLRVLFISHEKIMNQMTVLIGAYKKIHAWHYQGLFYDFTCMWTNVMKIYVVKMF